MCRNVLLLKVLQCKLIVNVIKLLLFWIDIYLHENEKFNIRLINHDVTLLFYDN